MSAVCFSSTGDIKTHQHVIIIFIRGEKSDVFNLSDICPEITEPVKTPQKKSEEVSGVLQSSEHTRSHCD